MPEHWIALHWVWSGEKWCEKKKIKGKVINIQNSTHTIHIPIDEKKNGQQFVLHHPEISDCSNVRKKKKGWVNVYLVFEIRRRATRLKKWLRIPQDDSFSSLINHILTKGFQVVNSLTYHLFSNADIFTWMFLHVFHWENNVWVGEEKWLSAKTERSRVPMELKRCSYVPGWLGWSKTMNRKFFQSKSEGSTFLINLIDSSKLSRPNLNGGGIDERKRWQFWRER